MFLFTDNHVADEGFLELVNNMLTPGWCPRCTRMTRRRAGERREG